jgi:hypothetical protein
MILMEVEEDRRGVIQAVARPYAPITPPGGPLLMYVLGQVLEAVYIRQREL